RLALVASIAVLVLPLSAAADHGTADDQANMSHLFNSPKAATNSDLAFWEDLAFAGNYDGFRIFDISDPARPVLLSDFPCRGPQNDVSVYKARGRLLLIQSIDRPQSTDACTSVDTPVSASPIPGNFGIGFNPGFEGLRVFDVSEPTAPRHIASVPTACGSHTHTTIPDKRNQRLLVYVSSYPLFGGATPPGFPDFGGPQCAPPHQKISIVEVSFANPEGAHVLKEQPLHADTLPFPGTAAIACHDIQAFLDPKRPIALAACNAEAQLWDISDPASPTTITAHTHIRNPNFDFFHSAEFTWDGEVVGINDEAFAHACTGPQSLKGNIWFYGVVPPGSVTAPLLGRYMIPRSANSGPYCSLHNANIVPVNDRYIGVASAYFGGTTIFDFTNPAAPVEIAYYDASGVDGHGPAFTWSSYWYNDYVYANDIIRGFDVFQPLTLKARTWHHLNPQTQEPFQTVGG
ncbi:MAG: LVIVD repeat-containing protein, partial [Gaiellaceae bacterium]